MGEDFIEDIYITPKPSVKFDGKLELQRDEKPEKSIAELEFPSIWSFYWRSAIWILVFGDLSSYLLLLIIPKTDIFLKLLPAISHSVLALIFLTISMCYKSNKITPMLCGQFHIKSYLWYKFNQLIMSYCVATAVLSSVFALTIPPHAVIQLNQYISLSILLAPGVAATYIVSLMKRTECLD